MNVSVIFASSFTYLRFVNEVQNRVMEQTARPFFTRHDFKQDFLTGTFSRAEVRDQVNPYVFAQGNVIHGATTILLGIRGVRSNSPLYGCTIRKGLVVVRRDRGCPNGGVSARFRRQIRPGTGWTHRRRFTGVIRGNLHGWRKIAGGSWRP